MTFISSEYQRRKQIKALNASLFREKINTETSEHLNTKFSQNILITRCMNIQYLMNFISLRYNVPNKVNEKHLIMKLDIYFRSYFQALKIMDKMKLYDYPIETASEYLTACILLALHFNSWDTFTSNDLNLHPNESIFNPTESPIYIKTMEIYKTSNYQIDEPNIYDFVIHYAFNDDTKGFTWGDIPKMFSIYYLLVISCSHLYYTYKHSTLAAVISFYTKFKIAHIDCWTEEMQFYTKLSRRDIIPILKDIELVITKMAGEQFVENIIRTFDLIFYSKKHVFGIFLSENIKLI
jgi:hypothetical protein